MKSLGIAGYYPVQLHRTWCGAERLHNHLNPNVLYRVCAPCMGSAHLLQSNRKIPKLQIFLVKQCFQQVYFFQRVKVPYARGRVRSVSKSQGGIPWGMHWRKRDCKIRYWRTETAYEAHLFWVSNHILVTPKLVICGQICRCRSDWRKEKALTRGDPGKRKRVPGSQPRS